MDYHQDIHSLPLNEEENLADLVSGKNGIVLVFIPDTHGISSRIQLKNLRNDHHKISELGFQILVITSEGHERSSASSDDLSLSFPIKHDEGNIFAKTFNTLGTKFENPFISERTKRRTYILDSDLNTMHVIDNIHPDFHSDEIIELLSKSLDISIPSSSDFSKSDGITSEK